MQSQHHKRRIKLPKPRFQLKLIGTFFGLCALTLLAQALVLGALLTRLATTLPSGGLQLAEALPDLVLGALAISFAVLLPAVLLIGIRVTFRVAGPIYRFEQHMRAVARGEQPGTCRIRPDDELQDFCGLLNDALEGARAQGEAAGRESQDGEERAA